MLPSFLLVALCGGLVSGGCRDTLGPFDRLQGVPPARLVTVSDTLFPEADSYIRQLEPNRNWGADTALELGGGGKSRVLVRFDSTALRQAVGAGTLDSAWLEFTIKAGPSGWGQNERTVDLHRLKRTWTELGATWNCAVDGNPANSVADCPSEGWDMTNNGNGTYHAVRTDRVTLNNGQTGVIRLNVTADVQGYLAGSFLSRGWVFRKTSEAQGGEAMVFSRESGSQPRLVVRVTTEDGPLPPLPSTVAWPMSPLSVVDPSDTTTSYYRDLIGVAFDSTATAMTFNALVAKYQATLIGGIGGGPPIEYYLLRFPDPGGSWTALDSLATAVRSEPGVVAILTFTSNRTIDLRGRFPNDIHIAPSRADWTGPGTARTWPWIAIRAPLAWGCEAGVYGGTGPRVAIADASFDVFPTDLVVSSASISTPSLADLTQPALDPDHGVAVASLFGARGDNGSQMAGMMWQADIELYASGSQQGQQDPMQFLRRVVSRAASQGVRVLGMSFGVGKITNATHIAEVRQAFKYYLDSGPDRLLVIATGQTAQPGTPGISASIQALSTATDTRLNASDRIAAELMLDPVYRGKILFVAGTAQTGQKWNNSHVWTGLDSTIIAAPAEAVYSLTGAGSLVPWSGTSFATPLVTGVAAQLWTMDPTLTAKEVVGYIVRGAQAPRLDPNGVLVPPADIGIAGVYQLDAYGALALLSAERPGTPICGYEVTAEDTTIGIVHSTLLRLEPPGRLPVTYPVPFTGINPDVSRLSVAQGGRRIAVNNLGAEAVLLDHHGQLIHRLTGRDRVYLERDTADIEYLDSGDPAVTLTGPGRGPSDVDLHPVAGRVTGALWALEISPTGQYIAYGLAASGGQTTHDWEVAPLLGGSSTSVWQFVDGGGAVGESEGHITWNHAGTQAAFAVGYSENVSPWNTGLLRSWTEPGTVQSRTLPGVVLRSPRFSGNDALVTTYEYGGFGIPSPCLETTRSASTASWGVAVGNAFAVAPILCGFYDGETVQSNLRRAPLSSIRGGPLPVPNGRTVPKGRLRVQAN